MDPQTLGLYGGIAGGVLGVLGGVVGTAASVRNTNGPRERAFVLRCAAVTWLVVTVSLAAGFLLPGPFRSLAMLPVFLALPWAIRAANRRQDELRREEQDRQPTGQGDGNSYSNT